MISQVPPAALPGLKLVAWALFVSTGVTPAVPTIVASFNVASMTHPFANQMAFTLTNALADANGIVVSQPQAGSGSATQSVGYMTANNTGTCFYYTAPGVSTDPATGAFYFAIYR